MPHNCSVQQKVLLHNNFARMRSTDVFLHVSCAGFIEKGFEVWAKLPPYRAFCLMLATFWLTPVCHGFIVRLCL